MDDVEPAAGFRYLGVRPPEPGDPGELGPYRIEGRIGAGGQGTVFLARAADGRPVAVKTLRPDPDAVTRRDPTADIRQRFDLVREVEVLSALPGSCSAALLDSDVAARVPYLVTEVLDGPSLAARVAADGPVVGAGLERLAYEILAVLDRVHRCGWVHRDVKPGNVLLGPRGPRLVDFDIAVPLGTPVPGADSGDGVYATPPFMAPEVLLGGPAGAASDIFSWACTIAFAATGRSPFQADDAREIVRRVEEREPSLVGVPGAVRPLLYRCLAKDPQSRPAADWLLDRLRELGAASGSSAAAAEPRSAGTPAWGTAWGTPSAPAPAQPAARTSAPPKPGRSKPAPAKSAKPKSAPAKSAKPKASKPSRPATRPAAVKPLVVTPSGLVTGPGRRPLPVFQQSLLGAAAMIFVTMITAAMASGVIVELTSAVRGDPSSTLPSGAKAGIFLCAALAFVVPVVRKVGTLSRDGKVWRVRRPAVGEAVILCLLAMVLAFGVATVLLVLVQGVVGQELPDLPHNETRVVVMVLASVILAGLLRRRRP